MKLQATVTGFPKPSVTWQLNDKNLSSAGPISIRTDDAGLSTLEVDDSNRLTAGKYRVVAENNLGSASADIEVTVTGQFVFIGVCLVALESNYIELTYSLLFLHFIGSLKCYSPVPTFIQRPSSFLVY